MHGDECEGDDDDAAEFGCLEACGKALCVPDGEQDEVDRCAADQGDDSGAQTVQDAADRADVAVLEEELGEQDAEDERREDEARRRRDGAPDARDLHAREGRGIDADGARRHLRDREDVDELRERQPAVFIDDGSLDERHGSVAAADAEDADLGEFEEKLEIDHDETPSTEFPVLHEDEADDAVDDNEQHDVDIEEHVGDEGREDDRHGQEEARLRLLEEEVDGDLQDERCRAALHTLQGELHRWVAREGIVAARDDGERDERRQHRRDERRQGACEACHAVAEDDAGVDSDDARHGLRDGDHVERRFVVNPAVFIDVFRLQERDDDEAAADRDGADDEGGREELPVEILGVARRRRIRLCHGGRSFSWSAHCRSFFRGDII